jgi:hypothetical protein
MKVKPRPDESDASFYDRKLKQENPKLWLQHETERAKEEGMLEAHSWLQSERQNLIDQLSAMNIWPRAMRRGAFSTHRMLVLAARKEGKTEIAEWLEAQELPTFGVKS